MADINTIIAAIQSSGIPQADKDFIVAKLNDSALSPEQKGQALSEFLDRKLSDIETKAGVDQTQTAEDAQQKLDALQVELDGALSSLELEAKT